MSCQCVRNHNPMPTGLQTHHVVPLAWRKRGAPSISEATVAVCGTTHDSIHNLLNIYVENGGPPDWPTRRQFSHYVRCLVEDAWDNRPKGKLAVTASCKR